MADDVPVYDVLCEAMEYLSKLGANLRVRSETLKEKRIRKEKLTNAHAVQKAANKVLLICELSKKSLQNVETGVKNVLSVIDAAQSTSAGDKLKSPKSDRKSAEFHWFNYQSHKLKISQKVPLKHYLSVKVFARKMPTSMQDKYPVYHDCKLYRLRKKLFKTQAQPINDKSRQKSEDQSPSKTKHLESAESESISKHMSMSSSKENSKDSDNNKDSPLNFNNKLSDRKSNENVNSENEEIHGHTKIKNKDPSDIGLSAAKKSSTANDEPQKKLVSAKNEKRKRNQIVDEDDTKGSDKVSKETKEEDVITLDDTISDDEQKQIDKHKSKKIKLNDSDSHEDIKDKENDRHKQEKVKHKECNNYSSGESESSKPVIKCVSLSKLLKPDVLKRIAENPSRTKSKNLTPHKKIKKKDIEQNQNKQLSKENKHKVDSDDEYWNLKRKEVKSFKPKTFIIKLTRLPKFSVIFLQEQNLRRIVQQGSIICEHKVDSPIKEADTNVAEQNDSAKKSFHNFHEVKNALLNDSDSDNLGANKTPENNKINEETVVVKNALLNESDSDKNEKADNEKNSNNNRNNDLNCSSENVKEKSKKTKKALLSSSDSDNINNQTKQDDNTKNMLSEDRLDTSNIIDETSPCQTENNINNADEKNKNLSQADRADNPDEIKAVLLNSSDDNTPKSCTKRRDSKSLTPRTKRKHIMESMHAKKMLLTYSSSSETEDEQLRGVLKQIKDSLLKGISSSDDEKNEKKEDKGHRRKLLISSDSDAGSKKESKEKHSEKHESDAPKENSFNKPQSQNESKGNNDEADAASDNQPDSSCSKMGHTKTNSSCSSTSQNSDSQDANEKDIDGLTNLKTLNKTRRRRGSASTESKISYSTRRKKKMSKARLISEENMLQAESSSDAASGAESEGAEELPPITLSGVNGDGISHLTKDDLLRESDSSSSNVEKENDSENTKKEDSEEENVKLKRRKPNAISSDSEAGSSRKKDPVAKLSDFEDSEEESSEPAKKAKRKKKDSDSDASIGSSSNEGSKKKRRRIKQVNDSDEGSGSDTETEGRNKHGRKNIRKVMGKNQLEEATKKAAREEKERIARIAERQKLYNNLEFDESGKPDEVVLEKVVLDFDPETKEPLIQVDRGLVKKLKPHQANGIKFMWDACFESVKRIKKDKGSGCILAHCMGLGKTLQVVSLTHTLLTHSSLTGVNRVLVVCPLSTVLNWVNEYKMWLKHAETEFEVDVYELSRYKQNSERAFQLQQWFENGGVCVLGYEMFRNLSADNAKKFKKKMLRHFQESLVDPGPDLVVCDEGHLLKNEKTSLSQSMNRVKTRRRIVLTGTPLQNNLKEYYCMVQFVKPNLLGKYNEYLNRFVNPITNGQYTDSTEHDIRVMKRRSHVLHKMLDGAVQRRDYGVLAPFLPPKHEYVLFITLTEVQIKLYQFYLDNYSRRPLPGKSSGFLFPDFQSLQRIWTHPLVLKYNSERYEIMQQKKREREEEDSEGSLADFIDDDSTPEETSTEESTDESSDMSDDSRKKSKKKKSSKKNKAKEGKVSTRRGTRANPVELEEEDKVDPDVLEVKNENPTEWWIKLVTDDELEDMRNSHKLVLLFDILRQCEAIGDKLLVFSQSLYSLDLIEHFLGKVDEATQEGRIDEKLGGHVGSWSPGIDYFRLDGSTSCENRSIWCKNFNREDNPRARLFLISTRAGGLGINLVAANRVVIFDVSWNPSHDVQSIFRVYRFGQKKPCYVYRFLAMGTMEEKIYERQVTKQAISKRVIDEQQIDRHYAENDLAELYKFEPRPPSPRPLPPLPKDRLFAEMLREHEAQIYKYHEHDSLLENKEEETLSEEERKAAWEDFENEKNRPPPAPFPSPWPMHNGMMPGLIQQQQLAYAALAAMLRKDMPNINDNQIRDMLPLIYNANPGLMQKMGEIYKYAQPGMMNPAMMNPVMNASGMGGTSGLQYEPPWQRQQQQQQQMRLQQLMQQQQNQQMGAKYYAGGLGSRDPVAMAMQQQRAREMMVGDRGRPRGRPPMQPTHSPTLAPTHPAHQDVVNLDSD